MSHFESPPFHDHDGECKVIDQDVHFITHCASSVHCASSIRRHDEQHARAALMDGRGQISQRGITQQQAPNQRVCIPELQHILDGSPPALG